ncbi:MAG: aldo/keto reductase [Clostridia bacterium]|nr:aldo/keto reductase [Clostridia bacterium]
MKKLGFGLMRLPLLEDGKTIDIERVKAMADAFIKAGFTYFDTAAPYHGGESEVAFREAVAKRYPRDAYILADKLSLFKIEKAEDVPSFFDSQLERLGVDHIDYYLLHAMSASSYERALDFGAFDFVAKKKAEGVLRHVGFSFHDSPEVLDRILTEHPEMEFVQLQINYLDWLDSGVQARACHEVARRHEKPVIVMEPVKGGALANISADAVSLFRSLRPELSTAGWAISYAASLDGVFMVLSGMSTEEQMAENIGYMKDFIPFSSDELAASEKAADIVRNDNAIACTSCRYCTDDCPQKIAIPDIFTTYNNFRRFGSLNPDGARGRYARIVENGGRASDCIECGLCEANCPQHLEIRALLKEMVSVLE